MFIPETRYKTSSGGNTLEGIKGLIPNFTSTQFVV